MTILYLASVAIGLSAGAAVGYVASRGLALRLAASSRHPSWVRASALVVGLLALIPAAFLAVVGGGEYGAGVGNAFLPEPIGAPLGLMLGLGTVLAIFLVLGSLVGALLGCGISALVRRGDEA